MEVQNFVLFSVVTATYGLQLKDTEGVFRELSVDSVKSKLGETFAAVIKGLENVRENSEFGEGRRRKKKKAEVMMMMKLLMGLKIALLGIVLPFGVIASKVLSWKAVTLSLLAFMLAKIVFVKNLFMSKDPPPTSAPSAQPPQTPIIIHSSSPSHDHVWKRTAEPKIHLQPEVHVHQASEEKRPTWSWSEARSNIVESDAHDIAYQGWGKTSH